MTHQFGKTILFIHSCSLIPEILGKRQEQLMQARLCICAKRTFLVVQKIERVWAPLARMSDTNMCTDSTTLPFFTFLGPGDGSNLLPAAELEALAAELAVADGMDCSEDPAPKRRPCNWCS